MPPISWSAAFCCGEIALDRQHAELVDIVNALESALASDLEKEAVDDCVRRLLAYSRFHFATEERRMFAATLPQSLVDAHLAQHQAFTEQVERFAHTLARPGQHEQGQAALRFLQDWLQNHIAVTDRALVDALSDQDAHG